MDDKKFMNQTERERLDRLEQEMSQLVGLMKQQSMATSMNYPQYTYNTPIQQNSMPNPMPSSPTSLNYSSDYQELQDAVYALKKENNQLEDDLHLARAEVKQRELLIDALRGMDDSFTPGQMNRNMMISEYNEVKPSVRLSQKYPITCTCCGKAIPRPDRAYDDLFPVSEYGRDIFCKDCFQKEVMPARIRRISTSAKDL